MIMDYVGTNCIVYVDRCALELGNFGPGGMWPQGSSLILHTVQG